MKKKMFLGALVLVLVVILAGCGLGEAIGRKAGEKMIEKTIESQTGGQVDINTEGGGVTVKTKDGQTQYSAGGDAKLPDNFPQELIIASDAKIIVSSSADNGQTVAYTTATAQEEIFSQYKTKLVDQGWKKDMEVDTGSGKMANFSKGDETTSITIGANNSDEQTGQTLVHIILVKNQSSEATE